MDDFATLRQRMVDNQIRPSDVTDHAVILAFLSIPREIFVSPAERPFAYMDRELKSDYPGSERLLCPPAQLARMVQLLPLGPNVRAMVIGCGAGYSAAILGRLVGEVVAVEADERLVALARQNLAAVGASRVEVVAGPLAKGCAARAPFQAILIDGAVEFVPGDLLGQLTADGALAVVERGGPVSRAMLYERAGGSTAKWPRFDAWAELLPGFVRKREFVF